MVAQEKSGCHQEYEKLCDQLRPPLRPARTEQTDSPRNPQGGVAVSGDAVSASLRGQVKPERMAESQGAKAVALICRSSRRGGLLPAERTARVGQ